MKENRDSKYFSNCIKSNPNLIVFTNLRSIFYHAPIDLEQQTDIQKHAGPGEPNELNLLAISNQSENGKYNLIWV